MKKIEKTALREKFLALPLWFWAIFAAVLGIAEGIRRFCFGGGCLLMDLFDFPCPTCGMTRATLCALFFRFDLAFRYNPVFWTAPLSGVCLIMAFIDKRHPKIWIGAFAALLAVLISAWVILRVIMQVPIPN